MLCIHLKFCLAADPIPIVTAIIGAVSGSIGTTLLNDWRKRKTERLFLHENLIHRYLLQVQDVVESLWYRFDNVKNRGGKVIMQQEYYEKSTLYALACLLAYKRILLLDGVYSQMQQLKRKSSFGISLKEKLYDIDKEMDKIGVQFYNYDRLSLAESVIKRVNGNLNLSTYLEFTERYIDSQSHMRLSLEPAKQFISSLEGHEVGNIMNELKDIAISIGNETGIKSQLSDESDLHNTNVEYSQQRILSDTRYVNHIYSQGRVMEFIRENKKRTKNRFYSLMCIKGFDKNYDDYFTEDEYEKDMFNRDVSIHRLINIETVGKSIIRKHLKKFSDVISDGKYLVTSTTFNAYEMAICFGYKEDYNLAIQLIHDPFSMSVDLALYSDFLLYIAAMTKFFESLENSGEKFNKYWDANKIDESIDKWFKACGVANP
jgi:hypothetical protein